MTSNTITKTNNTTYGYSTTGQINKVIGDQISKNMNTVSPINSTFYSKQDKSDTFLFTNRPPKENSNYNRLEIISKNKRNQTSNANLTTDNAKDKQPIRRLNTNEEDKDKQNSKDKKEKENDTNVIYQPPVPNMVILATTEYQRLQKENPLALKRLLDKKYRYNFPHAGVDLFM